MKLIVTLLGIATALSFGGRYHFMLDNLSSFKVHFVLAFLLCGVILFAMQQYRWATVSIVGLAVHFASIVPWYLAPPKMAEGRSDDTVKVLLANVSRRNTDYSRLTRLIQDEQPDLFGLVEVNEKWLQEISNIKDRYPYRFEAPNDDYWGLAIYSKLLMNNARILELTKDIPPIIVAEVVINGHKIELMLAHPRPPMSHVQTEMRNIQLREMARYISASELPVLLVGDLNTALWSPFYRDFVRESGLNNARAGSGVAGTWPPSPLLGVPIDHILSEDTVTLKNFQVLRRIGSDHLPISAEIILPVEKLAYQDQRAYERQ